MSIFINKTQLMPIVHKTYNIIKAAADADLDEEIYYQVYASAAATPTINGEVVGLAAGMTLDVLVQSISATANVFVIGDYRFSVDAPDTLSKYPEP